MFPSYTCNLKAKASMAASFSKSAVQRLICLFMLQYKRSTALLSPISVIASLALSLSLSLFPHPIISPDANKCLPPATRLACFCCRKLLLRVRAAGRPKETDGGDSRNGGQIPVSGESSPASVAEPW